MSSFKNLSNIPLCVCVTVYLSIFWWFVFLVDLTGFRIKTETHLWVCLWECFQKALTEKGLSLNMGGTIHRLVPKLNRKKKEFSLYHYLLPNCSHSVTNCFMRSLQYLPQPRWTATSRYELEYTLLSLRCFCQDLGRASEVTHTPLIC